MNVGITVNFKGVEAQSEPGAGPVPDGTYLVTVDEAGEKTSQKGTPGISLRLKILTGEFEGRVLFDDLWLTQNALGYVLHRLQCLGVKVPEGEFTIQPQGLVSRRAKVIVRQELDQKDQPRARVKGWEPASSQEAQYPFLTVPQVNGGHRDPTDDSDIPF